MNAVELIEEVIALVDDDWVDEERALTALNRAQLAVAREVLLPGLSDGRDTVTTLTDNIEVALPDDYHRELYHCQENVRGIKIWGNKSLLIEEMEGHLSVDNGGDVTDVCVENRYLVYQNVPSVAADLELFYYRKPTDMTESESSYPDGMEGEDLNHEFALIHHACYRLFLSIEAGAEGERNDSTRHKNDYDFFINEMSKGVNKSRPHRKPPICATNF